MKVLLIGFLLAFAVCHVKNVGRTDIYDPATYANVNEIQQTHLDLTILVDFEHQ